MWFCDIKWKKENIKRHYWWGKNTKGGGESSKKWKNSDRFSFLSLSLSSLSHNNTAFISDRYLSLHFQFLHIVCNFHLSFSTRWLQKHSLAAKSNNKEKVKERKRKKETTDDRATTQREKERESVCVFLCVCICMRVCLRYKEREKNWRSFQYHRMENDVWELHILSYPSALRGTHNTHTHTYVYIYIYTYIHLICTWDDEQRWKWWW